MEGSSAIPIIDIRPWTHPDAFTASERDATAAEIGKACRDIGFFAVTGHSVNTSTIDTAWKASKDFFDLPLPDKLASKTNNEREYPYGFEHSERLQLGKEGGDSEEFPPDLKETFSLGPSNPASGMPARRFPTEPKGFKVALEEYYGEMEQLALTILRIFAVSLDLPEDWFVNKMDHHMSALRILNYPPIDLRTLVQPGEVVRASAHTDYGALTILRSGGPGLQVKKDNELDEWIDVPSLPDTFIINLGDLMQRWTNDKWVSTLHRVILLPPSYNNNDKQMILGRRQSIAFFCNINGDAIVEPIGNEPKKYPPITAKEHLMAKHLASMMVAEMTISKKVNCK